MTGTGFPSCVEAGLNLYCFTADRLFCSNAESVQWIMCASCGFPCTSTTIRTLHRPLTWWSLASAGYSASTELSASGGVIFFVPDWSDTTGASAACCPYPSPAPSTSNSAITQKRLMNLSTEYELKFIRPVPAPAAETRSRMRSPSGSRSGRSRRRVRPPCSSPAAADCRPS